MISRLKFIGILKYDSFTLTKLVTGQDLTKTIKTI